ncbi:REP-associated tyrosine transposase [Lysobacter sp. F6437]|uniref:REP-associated tyrosine transposase n=1 Tax=Lysobacter sp. F6437 TaxID=3459296 RepID=UPI00403DE3D5
MGHARLRLGRHSLDGQVYLVTFTTAGRQPHFADGSVATSACRLLTATTQWQRSRLLAWVLMPDHWHGLVELGGFDSLPACVGRVKGRSARLLRQAHPEVGAVWAPAYHDRALRAEEQLVDAARYVVMNPVRARLVRRVGDYPYWDAVWL